MVASLGKHYEVAISTLSHETITFKPLQNGIHFYTTAVDSKL